MRRPTQVLGIVLSLAVIIMALTGQPIVGVIGLVAAVVITAAVALRRE